MRASWPTLALAALALTAAPDARAACDNPLINACLDSDTLWPNPGPMRFAGVAGTPTVKGGQLGFGLVATYLSRPLLLHVASPGPGGSDQAVIGDQVNGNFLFAYGVTDRLELDVALPLTFVQSGAGTSPITGGDALHDTALRDLRFGVAYALVPRARVGRAEAAAVGGPGRSWSLTARFQTKAPTGDDSQFAGERAAVFVPSLAADYRLGRAFAGVELGARIRPVTEFAGARIGTQLVTAAGVGLDVLSRDRLALMLEGRAYPTFAGQRDTSQSAFGITSTPNGKSILPAEWMLGARSAPVHGGDISFYVGGGGPIPTGDPAATVPRYRFVVGATYAPLGRDRDKEHP